MQTIKKGKVKFVLAIGVLLLAVAVFFYIVHGSDINMATICKALLYAELPLVLGIVLLAAAIVDYKDGKAEKQWKEGKKP